MSVNDYYNKMMLNSNPLIKEQFQELATEVNEDIQKTFNHLNQLWDQVYMEAENRVARMQQACDFVHNLLQDILKSEEEMVKSVATDLEIRRKAVIDLRKLLNQPAFNEALYPPGSITLLKALDEELICLNKKRNEVMSAQLETYEKYERICQRLGIIPENIEDIQGRIFTNNELRSLQNKLSELKHIFSKRLESALQLQSEAKKILNLVQLPANNSIGKEDFQNLEIDLHTQGAVLSQELLDHLMLLNKRLKDYYDSWIEQVAFRYDEMLVKLDELSEKCFRPPFSKDRKQNINYENLTEHELQKLENELKEHQELYDRAQPVFDKLNEWMESWRQKLDTERRVCRASFYKNRAGSLNAKIKQRKLVEQKVPKLYNELHDICEDYVKNYRVYDILVEGLRADKYAESVMKNYTQDREFTRVQKQIAASKIAQTPGPKTLWPSKMGTVFATSTPSRSAMRTLKMQQPPATVGPMPIRRKRSFSCSQLSAIYPLNTPMSGPRTSSPKPNQADFS